MHGLCRNMHVCDTRAVFFSRRPLELRQHTANTQEPSIGTSPALDTELSFFVLANARMNETKSNTIQNNIWNSHTLHRSRIGNKGTSYWNDILHSDASALHSLQICLSHKLMKRNNPPTNNRKQHIRK